MMILLQAAFYCQQAFKNGQVFQSRNVYVYGNRNFVNANMAYHAAETFPTYPASRSGVYPVVEAIQLVVTPNPHRFNNSDLRYHDQRINVTHKFIVASNFRKISTVCQLTTICIMQTNFRLTNVLFNHFFQVFPFHFFPFLLAPGSVCLSKFCGKLSASHSCLAFPEFSKTSFNSSFLGKKF